MFKLRAWTFGNGAMRFHCNYKVPQEQHIIGRNKQEKTKGGHSKQSKTSAVLTKLT